MQSVFDTLKDHLFAIDPVSWAQNNLTLDGRPLRLIGNGYKPFVDIYRYIGVTALGPNSKPVVLVKGRQIGATTMASVLELFFMGSGVFGTHGRPPMRVLHAFPLLDIAYTYSKTKLNPMITSAKPDPNSKGKPKSIIETKIDKTASANDSLNFKAFENGNHIQIESTGLDANRLRGRTIDCILFDEVQDISRQALVNAEQILAKAQYGQKGSGMRVYFGTPKQKGNVYWDIWQNSTQQYYYLGCESCEKHFPLYTPGSDEWEKIWIEDNLPHDHKSHGFIVKCTHCGCEQDKRDAAERGKWVASKSEEEADDCEFIGYHINQLYMPDIPRDKIIAKKPENSEVYTERAYQNEVLGEFFAGDAAPLSIEEIQQLCVDKDRPMRGSIPMSEDNLIYLGCDWGGKDDIGQIGIGETEKKTQGRSYSCVVVISVQPGGIINIEYASLLKKNNLEYKKQIVEEIFRKFSVTRAVGDIGYAKDLSEILHQEHGDRFLTSQASGAITNHYKFIDDIFPQEIRFEKDYLIAEVITMMKNGKIRFPGKSYDMIGWLVQHCASMEIKPYLDKGGNIKIKYVKGSTQNDGFMALLNAVLAFKFDSTKGFTINHPDRMKTPTKKKSVLATVGYIPKMRA